MYQNFIIPYLYEAQHVSVDTPPNIRRLNLHWHPLVFHTWKVVRRSWWTLSGTVIIKVPKLKLLRNNTEISIYCTSA